MGGQSVEIQLLLLIVCLVTGGLLKLYEMPDVQKKFQEGGK